MEAIIYCRVSSKKQMSEGSGLESQEHRCRQYAASKGYAVTEIFREEGITGGTISRPAMQRLLAYVKSKRDPVAVVIDDIKRFTRDVDIHRSLKRAIASRGGQLESPSFRFEDTPEGLFVETVLAGTAELERNQNRQQVMNRMRARIEMGYWPFRTPPGYRLKRVNGTRVIVPDEPKASMIRDALEEFASGRLDSKTTVVGFLRKRGYFPAKEQPRLSVELTLVTTMLRQTLYAGYVEYKPWGVAIRKGAHEGLVSLQTFLRVQERLDGRAVSHVRDDPDQPTYPLKKLAVCGKCGKPLTGSACRGRSKRYPYYHCFNRYCPEYGKGTAKEEMERRFADQVLKNAKPKPGSLAALKRAALDAWNDGMTDVKEAQAAVAAEAAKVKAEIDGLASTLSMMSNGTAIKAVETRIEGLEVRRLTLPVFGEKAKRVRKMFPPRLPILSG
jgi:DNA invertase Pin-like site-specific DNA recombinase